MTKNHSPRRLSLFGRILCLPILFAIASAQQAPNPTSPANPPVPDEVVELSPFVVSTTQDVGYLATNTLAGSRFNTSLRDTPATISVLTSEFLSDLGAFDLTEAVGYAVNVELQLDDDRPATNGNETISSYQGYRVRGMRASTARNYFLWDLPTETALVERIEDSRGPNSVLFGIASPGGLLNANTKQALTGRAFQRGSVTFGSFDTRRATLDLNQPLLDRKLAARVNLVYNDTQHFRHWAFQKQMRGHITTTYRLTDNTRIRAEFEKGQIDSNQPKTIVLLDNFLQWDSLGRPTFATVPAAAVRNANFIAQNSTAANQPRVTYIAGLDTVLAMRGTMVSSGPGLPIMDRSISDHSINVGGPGQDRFSRFNAFSAFIEHRFSPTAFMELAFNHQDHVFDRYDARGGNVNNIYGDPNLTLPGGAPNPYAGQLMLESSWTRLLRRDNSDTGRITLSKEFDAKKWGHYRIAALGEYEKSFTGTNVFGHKWMDANTGLAAFNVATPSNAQNNVWLRSYVTERDWASYHVPNARALDLQNVFDPITGRMLSAQWIDGNPNEAFFTRKAAMLAGQARFFEGKLVLAGGVRRDDLTEHNLGSMLHPVTREEMIARNPADADQSAPRWENNVGTTRTVGVVYHVTPWASLIYNRADNLELPSRGQTTLPPDGMPGDPVAVPPPDGEGQDFGVGLSLLDGRVYTKVLYYKTAGRNQSTTFSAPTRQANTRILDALQSSGIISQDERDFRNRVGGQGLFDHESKGIELQVTANPTTNWRFTGSYAQADAVESNKFTEWLAWEQQNLAYIAALNAATPTDVYAITTSADGGSRTIRGELDFIRDGDNALGEQTESSGIGKLGNRRHKVSFFTRYTIPSGFARGLYVGGGYKHQSKMYAGLNQGEKIFTNSFWSADAMAGYSVRGLRKGRKLSFQLNVNNVFDRRDPLITRLNSSGEVIRLVVQPPMTWRLSTNFEF